MRKTLTSLLLAALVLVPFATRAQSGSSNGYYDRNGVWHAYQNQDGYYDSNGVWHPSSTQSGGYYDSNGVWHAPNDNAGYYDRNGVWHPGSTQTGGYYDSNGVWHPYQPQSTDNGYYDRDGQWHPYANESGGGYYDQYGRWVPTDTRSGYYDRNGQWRSNANTQGYSYRNGRWVPDRYARIVGPDRWTWSDRGRSESLRTATANLAFGSARIEREARRRSTYGDAAAFDALQRLTVSAAQLDRLVQARAQNDAIGAAYRDVVNSFAFLQGTYRNLQADSWLQNQLNVLFAQVGRLDHRFFGDRAFGGVNPGRTY